MADREALAGEHRGRIAQLEADLAEARNARAVESQALIAQRNELAAELRDAQSRIAELEMLADQHQADAAAWRTAAQRSEAAQRPPLGYAVVAKQPRLGTVGHDLSVVGSVRSELGAARSHWANCMDREPGISFVDFLVAELREVQP